MDTSAGRAEYMNSAIKEADSDDDSPDVVEPLSDDSTAEERSAYFEARINGAEIEGETEE
jgi:hypothetical protein